MARTFRVVLTNGDCFFVKADFLDAVGSVVKLSEGNHPVAVYPTEKVYEVTEESIRKDSPDQNQ
jgi:hypothetical protein